MSREAVPSRTTSAAPFAERRARDPRFEGLKHVFDAISDMVVLIAREADGGYRCLEANEAVSRMEGIPLEAILGKRVDEIHPPAAYAEWKAIYDRVVATRASLEVEHDVSSPLGVRNRVTRFFPVPGDGEGVDLLLGICRDVTEAKAATREREERLRHLEALDRVSAILSQELDVENVLQGVTAALVDIFAADRAWIADNCDPDAADFHLAFITGRPEFPGPPRGTRVPMDPVSAAIVREVIASDGPVAYDASHPMPGGREYLEKFGIRSQMLMTIRPRAGSPWCLGLHQCSRERAWSPYDRRLFREIVLRVKGALENLLLHRDLVRSRETYHLMTEVMPQLVWTTDGSGRVDFVNRRWLEFTGQAPEHAVGTGGLDALHPEDVPRCLEAWNAALAAGSPYEVELRYRRADGAWVWHLTRAYPQREPDGRVRRWIGTCTDISAMKRQQEEAARARAEIDAILHGVDEGISAQDPTGRLIYANQKFAAISGFPSPAAFLAAPLEERARRYALYEEDGTPVTWERLPGRRVLAGEDSAQMIMRFVDRADGRELWVNAKSTAVRGPDGTVAMAINFAQDITAARAAREELVRSREQLSTLLSGVSEAIIAQEPGGRVVYANEAAARLFDLPDVATLLELSARPAPPGSDHGLHLFDEQGAELPLERTPMRLARQGSEPPAMLLRFRLGRKGRDRWVVSRAKPILDAEGKVSLVIGMTQDISELREKEEAVRRLQKMESLGKLAGGIAHDFNNLLVTINGYSELGRDGATDRPDLGEFFREILQSGRRAAALTQQLLAYSRKQIVQPRPLSLDAVVGDMDKLLRRLIGEDIGVRTALAGDLPRVQADPSQVEQVVLNLVVNARDAMPSGGDLTLRTGRRRLEAADLAGNPDARPGDYAWLSVADTGVGMLPEVLERAFEPFFTTKEVGKGTGLGLASVYGIVQHAGGHIAVRSEPGAGSTFTVYLPAMAGEGAASEGEAPAAPEPGRGSGTLLLVEDEDSVRSFTRKVLEDRGYRVAEARDGAEALLMARALPALDLLLTDVVMPGMRGTALVEEVRRLHPRARAVLMSGHPGEAPAPPGGAGEAPRFLQKPYRVEDLVRAVEAALEEKPA